MAGPTNITLGRQSVLGIGVESTYGTAVSRSLWFPVISYKVKEEITQVPRPHIAHGDGGVASDFVQTASKVMWEAEIEVMYSAIGAVFYMLTGEIPADAGAGPYTHTFKMDSEPPSFTMEFVRGTITGGGTTRAEVVDGAVMTQGTLTVQAGQAVARLRIQGFGQGVTQSNSTVSSITRSTPAVFHEGSAISWNSQSYPVNSFELTVTNPYAERYNIGSLETDKPYIEGIRTVQATVQAQVANEDWLTAHPAYTESDLVFTLTGASPLEIEITLHSARILTGVDVPVNSVGRLTQTATFAARNVPGGTDLGLQIVVTNSLATYGL